MDTTNIRISREQLERHLALQKLQIKRLLDITQAINNNIGVGELFEMYKNTLTHEMRVGKFALYIYQNDYWECVSHMGLSEGFLNEPIGDAFDQYTRFTGLRDVTHPLLREFDFILPVYHKKQPIACTLLKNIKIEDDDDIFELMQFISTITNIIAVAIENKRLFKRQLEQERLKHELALAVQMQNMLIPSILPRNQRYEFAGVYQPHEGVGGDYYDFIKIDDEEIAFCIADISGKGMAAALLMSNFQASLHSLIYHKNLHVRKFTEQLNSSVMRATKGDKFITFFVARYDLVKKRLRYLCAGHNPPLLVSGGRLRRLDKGCTILGVFPTIPKIEMGEITLEEDAFLLLYTDGLTDLYNAQHEHFGDERLEAFVLQHHQADPATFNALLMNEIHQFKGEQDFPDDISVLTGRIFVDN